MKKVFIIIFICMLLGTQIHGAEFLLRLPVSAVVTSSDNSGKTWSQNGYLPVTYVTALKQMSSALRAEGWKQIQHINLKKSQSSCIMVWQRQNRKITVMIWKVLIDQTGFSWGVNRDK